MRRKVIQWPRGWEALLSWVIVILGVALVAVQIEHARLEGRVDVIELDGRTR